MMVERPVGKRARTGSPRPRTTARPVPLPSVNTRALGAEQTIIRFITTLPLAHLRTGPKPPSSQLGSSRQPPVRLLLPPGPPRC